MTDLNIVQPLNNTGVWRHSSHIIMKINLPAKKKKNITFGIVPLHISTKAMKTQNLTRILFYTI